MIRPLTAAILAATLATTPAHAIEGRTGVFGGWANAVSDFFNRNAKFQQGPYSTKATNSQRRAQVQRDLDSRYLAGTLTESEWRRQSAENGRNDPSRPSNTMKCMKC